MPIPTNPDQSNQLDPHRPDVQASLTRYWRSNVRIMTALLIVWAVVGLGCGILFADWLNQFTLPGFGFPVGFWFAHQSSIVVFVLLILAYCLMMNRADARHYEELEQLNRTDQHNG